MMFVSNLIKDIIHYLIELKFAGIKLKKIIKKNDELVETKKIEIENFMAENRSDIESGKLGVYMIDECHLPGGVMFVDMFG